MNPDAILSADIHIQESTPICRTDDDYILTQMGKLLYMLGLCKKYNCPLIIAGDFGDRSQWSNQLLQLVMATIIPMQVRVIVVPGQHDLPNHNLELWKQSGIGVLHEAGVVEVLLNPTLIKLYKDPNVTYSVHPFPFGTDIEKKGFGQDHQPSVAVAHKMLVKNEDLFPGQEATQAKQLLKKYTEYSLIVTGDNHKAFTAEKDGRVLVNPGSMTRKTSDQINFKPRCYLWEASTNTVERHFIPIKPNVVTDIHIIEKEKKAEALSAFVDGVEESYNVELQYTENFISFFNNNTVPKNIQNLIWTYVGEKHGFISKGSNVNPGKIEKDTRIKNQRGRKVRKRITGAGRSRL